MRYRNNKSVDGTVSNGEKIAQAAVTATGLANSSAASGGKGWSGAGSGVVGSAQHGAGKYPAVGGASSGPSQGFSGVLVRSGTSKVSEEWDVMLCHLISCVSLNSSIQMSMMLPTQFSLTVSYVTSPDCNCSCITSLQAAFPFHYFPFLCITSGCTIILRTARMGRVGPSPFCSRGSRV